MGLVQKWITEFLPKKDRCSSMGKTAELENHTVNLNDMQGCFFVLITGKYPGFLKKTKSFKAFSF